MVDDARGAGVDRLITVGTDAARSADAVAAAARHPGVVWATVGLHPHDASDGLDGSVDLLGRARGWWRWGSAGSTTTTTTRPATCSAGVRRPDRLAHEHDLALVIHTRSAWDDTFAVLDAEGVPERTVFHCFTGGPDEAAAASTAAATCRSRASSRSRRPTTCGRRPRRCPIDRVLVETDSPYLAPVPHRGRPNRPALVPVVGAALAAAMGTGGAWPGHRR